MFPLLYRDQSLPTALLSIRVKRRYVGAGYVIVPALSHEGDSVGWIGNNRVGCTIAHVAHGRGAIAYDDGHRKVDLKRDGVWRLGLVR